MNDVRLIDANALLEEIDEEIEVCQPETTPSNKFISIGLKTAKKDIKRAPTVDPAPVKYGKWVLQFDGCSLQKCSCCGYEYSDRIECDNFCGNCGADMRPGKTGKWIDRTLHHYYDYPKFICSICGKILELDKKRLPCECPKCGAKMDGGDTNGNQV